MELYITLALLSVVLSLTIAIHIHLSDKDKRYRYFVLVMVASAVWAFFSIFWLLLHPPLLFIAYKVSFVGIITLPVLLFLTSLEYRKSPFLLRKNACLPFWIIPAISLLAMATNPLHGLFWKDIIPGPPFEGIMTYRYHEGPMYWFHTAYSYLMIMAAIANLFVAMWQKKKVWVFFFVLAGIMVPVTANVMVITGYTDIDYTPIMLSFASVAFGWTISVGFYSDSIRQLKSLQHHTNKLNELYNVVVQISEELIQSELDQLKNTINKSLARLGQYNLVDRVYIFEYDPDTDQVSNTYEWCAEGITPEIDNLQGIPYEFIPRWKERFSQKEHVYIESVKDLQGEDRETEKAILEPQGIQSLIVVPMFFGGLFVGFMGFDSVRASKVWESQSVNLLRMMGNIIGGSIIRIRFENMLIAEKHNAEAANRAKSEFLANMSHEIRTPLNAILGFSRIAADDTQEEETRDHLDIVLSSGTSLMRLINDLLDFSKIEAGMLQLHPSEIQLSSLLLFVHKTFVTQATQKGLDLRIDVANGADKVFLLDESRVRQVLFNLVGNAVKFTDKGHIHVKASTSPSPSSNGSWQITFEVSDTGIGIADHDQQAIFQVFNQLSRGDGRKYEGTGLGLNISRRLVELMNGRIELHSVVGQGSTFRVILPEVKAV